MISGGPKRWISGRPPVVLQGGDRRLVPGSVAFKFFGPELRVRRRNLTATAAGVRMPEATVDEYSHLAGSHHDVGASGQFLCVKTEADAHGMQRPAYDHLRPRVLAAHLRQEGASLFGGQEVGHDLDMVALSRKVKVRLPDGSRLAKLTKRIVLRRSGRPSVESGAPGGTEASERVVLLCDPSAHNRTRLAAGFAKRSR